MRILRIACLVVCAAWALGGLSAGREANPGFAERNPALVYANTQKTVDKSTFVPYQNIRENVPADPSAFARYFEERNAAANAVLAPPGAPRYSGTPALPCEMTFIECPFCQGAGGPISVREPEKGQNKGRMGKAKMHRFDCPLCGGTLSPRNLSRMMQSKSLQDRSLAFTARVWQSYIPSAKLGECVTLGYRDFEHRHRAAGDVQVGFGFVPGHVAKGAGRKELKLFEEVFGKPCQKCNWTGVVECKKCKGAGFLPCRNKDCEDGWVTKKEVERIRNYKSRHRGWSSVNSQRNQNTETREHISVSLCPDCKGGKFIVCGECDGLGATTCPKCRGLGFKQKR